MKHAQKRYELDNLLKYIKENNVCRILEIGSRYGHTLDEMVRAMPPSDNSYALSIELPNGPWGRTDSLPELEDRIRLLNDDGYTVELLLGESQNPEIYEHVLSKEKFDLILIDGDHSYNAVKADFEIYGEHAKNIVFHDIAAPALDVKYVWGEITRIHKNVKTFIEDIDPVMGIGILINE